MEIISNPPCSLKVQTYGKSMAGSFKVLERKRPENHHLPSQTTH
jgi:hypothetical protein